MPINSGHMISRQNLMHLLDSLSGERIIYICAPAGYGKTVSVRQWLKRKSFARAVISLDEYDNDPARFCRRFCSALPACGPKNVVLREIACHPAFDSAPEEFTLRAIAALSEKKRTCLVLDDLHLISDEKVLRLLLGFLTRLPESFRLVLISRCELPPGFSDLWIKGRLARVTEENLRFSREEIKLLYEKNGARVTARQAGEIYNFTDGWAIGVNALLLSGGEPSGENLEYLEDFIRTNVWERWDEATREFMLKTAVARELTPSLCAALTDEEAGEARLRGLARQNAFISRSGPGAYRYHQLFHSFLRRMAGERGKEFTFGLLEKMGGWYLEQQDFHNAADCFIKCESLEGAAKCFSLLVTAGGEYLFIERLLPVAGPSIIRRAAEKFPYIYSMLSWAAFNEGRAADMAKYADLYYANQTEIIRLDPRLALNVTLVRLVDFRNPLHDLARAAKASSANFPAKNLSDMGVSVGTINQNMPLLHRGTRDFSEFALGNIGENVAGIKDALSGLFGEDLNLLAECLNAGLSFERGYLEKAHSHALAANVEIRNHFSPETKFFAMSMLVCVLDALEQRAQAEQALKRVGDMIERDRAYYLSYNFSALAARRKLANGDMEAARDWVKAHEAPLRDDLDFYKIYGHFTTCRAYITLGDYDAAIILLTKALKLAESYNRPLDVIEAQILLAIACWKKKRGFQREAMRYLERAVSISHGYGYIQIFVNEGAELAGMIRRLQKRAEQLADEAPAPASFIKMLYLKTLEHPGSGLTSGRPAVPVKFTDKQKSVMRLLCEGKTYREIAEGLGIKLPTLRSHISLIYKKLGVTSETDAITKIKALGIPEEG